MNKNTITIHLRDSETPVVINNVDKYYWNGDVFFYELNTTGQKNVVSYPGTSVLRVETTDFLT